jgi:hypothetical protein
LGGGRKFKMADRGMKLPVTMGHEPYGTVLSGGPDAGPCPSAKIVWSTPGQVAVSAHVAKRGWTIGALPRVTSVCKPLAVMLTTCWCRIPAI